MEGGRKTKTYGLQSPPPPRPPFAAMGWGADKGQLDRELDGAAAAAPDRPGMPPNPTEPEAAAASAPPRKKWTLPGKRDEDVEVVALSPGTLMASNSRFICEMCGQGFQRDQNLQLHRRGHNLPWRLRQRGPGAAPPLRRVYVCPEPGCVHHSPAHALGDLMGIKKHFCRKHGEKRWACPRCGKRYAVQADLKGHAKICSTREYRCDCGTLFTRRDSFVTHRAFCDALVDVDKTAASVLTVEENVDKDESETSAVDKDESETSAVAKVDEPQPQPILPQVQQPDLDGLVLDPPGLVLRSSEHITSVHSSSELICR